MKCLLTLFIVDWKDFFLKKSILPPFASFEVYLGWSKNFDKSFHHHYWDYFQWHSGMKTRSYMLTHLDFPQLQVVYYRELCNNGCRFDYIHLTLARIKWTITMMARLGLKIVCFVFNWFVLKLEYRLWVYSSLICSQKIPSICFLKWVPGYHTDPLLPLCQTCWPSAPSISLTLFHLVPRVLNHWHRQVEQSYCNRRHIHQLCCVQCPIPITHSLDCITHGQLVFDHKYSSIIRWSAQSKFTPFGISVYNSLSLYRCMSICQNKINLMGIPVAD